MGEEEGGACGRRTGRREDEAEGGGEREDIGCGLAGGADASEHILQQINIEHPLSVVILAQVWALQFFIGTVHCLFA